MIEVKTFKIEQKFSGTEDLYKYLLNNINFIGETIGIKIQKSIKDPAFYITGKEKITERNILFFASKSEATESLEELIILAEAFNVDIIVFFMQKTNKTYLESLNWLQKNCNNDYEFIIYQADF